MLVNRVQVLLIKSDHFKNEQICMDCVIIILSMQMGHFATTCQASQIFKNTYFDWSLTHKCKTHFHHMTYITTWCFLCKSTHPLQEYWHTWMHLLGNSLYFRLIFPVSGSHEKHVYRTSPSWYILTSSAVTASLAQISFVLRR